ncbi:ribosomal protein RPL27 [Cardiosporidium cionae]|uniref:Ribosomal protein RPL27 n=1 Tax=Cardiosporidium cionae TaxID=476202 RepID=A0ABQ7JFP3_9APIC|nr:ribosomal protein RPL27 [Cardiosporidium cionae]|eukprot:KAF8822831.1 ribosomal protein RPL27 [Cardiosporidium cionae]
MGKLLKTGRIVIVLAGRMAGKKGIVVSCNDSGTDKRPFGHCLIAGVEKAPLKITNKMGKKKVEKRSRVKPFLRYINVNHLMVTRYSAATEVDCKNLVTDVQMEDRAAAKKSVKTIFQERFSRPVNEKSGKVVKDLLFLRKKLRF